MTDDRYQLLVLTRCHVGALHLTPGQVLTVAHDRLRVAAHLCRCGTARPADKATATDVALFEALRVALPAA
jgi:hypothetical protein